MKSRILTGQPLIKVCRFYGSHISLYNLLCRTLHGLTFLSMSWRSETNWINRYPDSSVCRTYQFYWNEQWLSKSLASFPLFSRWVSTCSLHIPDTLIFASSPSSSPWRSFSILTIKQLSYCLIFFSYFHFSFTDQHKFPQGSPVRQTQRNPRSRHLFDLNIRLVPCNHSCLNWLNELDLRTSVLVSTTSSFVRLLIGSNFFFQWFFNSKKSHRHSFIVQRTTYLTRYAVLIDFVLFVLRSSLSHSLLNQTAFPLHTLQYRQSGLLKDSRSSGMYPIPWQSLFWIYLCISDLLESCFFSFIRLPPGLPGLHLQISVTGLLLFFSHIYSSTDIYVLSYCYSLSSSPLWSSTSLWTSPIQRSLDSLGLIRTIC